MNFLEYRTASALTEAPVGPGIIERISDPLAIRLLHGVIGICTEVGEFQESLMETATCREKLDLVNVREELGDIMWYVALVANVLDFEPDFGTVILDYRDAAAMLGNYTGQLQDVMKRHVFYGKPYSREQIIVLVGILCGIINSICIFLDITWESVYQANVDKLQKKRYKDKVFTETEAINRDVAAERQGLEEAHVSRSGHIDESPIPLAVGEARRINPGTKLPAGKYEVNGTSASRATYNSDMRMVDEAGFVRLESTKYSGGAVGKVDTPLYHGTTFRRIG